MNDAMFLMTMLTGIWAACGAVAFANRMRSLHYSVEPAGFVALQAIAGVYCLLIWLSLVQQPVQPDGVAGLAMVSLYFWRSRERMHLFNEARSGSIPRECPRLAGNPCPLTGQPADLRHEDVPDTRITLRRENLPGTPDSAR